MARREQEDTSRKGGGVSLEPEDKISVGLFGPGPAKIVESIFAEYNYGGKSKAVPVWLITYDRDGEKGEQPYSVGSGWRVSSDGESLIPRNGQTGLPDSCNAILLLDSLRKAGLAKGFMSQHGNNPRCLEGMEVVLKREAQPDRGLESDRKSGEVAKVRTILLIESIEALPGEGKSTGKGKKAKPAEADTSEEDGIEALIEVLEANKGKVAIDDIERLVKRHLKGQDNAVELAELCASDDFLSLEKSWSVNAKKGVVSLD
jgi:hypothetical protein